MKQNIESAGAYVPRYRLSADEIEAAWGDVRARGVQTKAVPGPDEDSVTMAVAAVRDALADSRYDPGELSGLALGTTTPPVDEEDVGVRVAEAAGLPRAIEVATFSQSTRAGTRALLSALRMDGPAVAVAADCPLADPGDALEHAAGAGAVALVAADDGPVAVTDVAAYARAFPGTRFRERGDGAVDSYDATQYDREAVRTVAGGALEGVPAAPAIAPTAPDGDVPYRAAGAAPFDAEVSEVASDLGDAGAASPLLGLVAAWGAGHEAVVVLGYGSGAGADALRLEGSLDADWDRETEALSYPAYLRQRGHVGGGDD